MTSGGGFGRRRFLLVDASGFNIRLYMFDPVHAWQAGPGMHGAGGLSPAQETPGGKRGARR